MIFAFRGRRLRELLDGSVSFVVSLVFHVLMLLMLAMLTYGERTFRPLVLAMAPIVEEPEAITEVVEFEPVATPDLVESLAVQAAAVPEVTPAASGAAIPTPEVDLVAFSDLPLTSPTMEIAQLTGLMQEVPRFGGGSVADAEVGENEVRELDLRLAREHAQTGDIQISLMWNNLNDLDLHVVCPCPDKICYLYKRSRCGGELDVDMNVRNRPPMSWKPVENVYWPVGGAPRGEYYVFVDHFSNNGCPDPTHYRGIVRINGKIVNAFSGRIYFGSPPHRVHRFKYSGAAADPTHLTVPRSPRRPRQPESSPATSSIANRR